MNTITRYYILDTEVSDKEQSALSRAETEDIMTDREIRMHRDTLRTLIRNDYKMMKETYSRNILEYMEGHVRGLLSGYNMTGVISCKVRFKYDDFIEAVYESRKAVCV